MFFRGSLYDEAYEILGLVSHSLQSGLSLEESIRISVGHRTGRLRSIDRSFLRLADRIEKGEEPKKAVKRVGFPRRISALFQLALEGRNFSKTFSDMVRLEETRSQSLGRIVRGSVYPCLVVALLLLLGVFFFGYIVPSFEKLFFTFDTKLPVMTEWVLMCSRFVRSPFFWMEILFVLFFLFFFARWFYPRLWMNCPLVGEIGTTLHRGPFLRMLSVQILQETPLPEALGRCAKLMRNPGYKRDCISAMRAARGGMLLEEIVLRFYWLFPSWVFPVVAEGNSPQSIAKIFEQAAQSEENRLETSLNMLQTTLIPFVLAGLMLFCGFCIIAMFMPMIKLIMDMS